MQSFMLIDEINNQPSLNCGDDSRTETSRHTVHLMKDRLQDLMMRNTDQLVKQSKDAALPLHVPRTVRRSRGKHVSTSLKYHLHSSECLQCEQRRGCSLRSETTRRRRTLVLFPSVRAAEGTSWENTLFSIWSDVNTGWCILRRRGSAGSFFQLNTDGEPLTQSSCCLITA